MASAHERRSKFAEKVYLTIYHIHVKAVMSLIQLDVSEEKTLEVIEEEERKYIIKAARQASLAAIEETFRQGRPVTIVEGDSIVKKYSDGRTEIIKKLEKNSVTPKKRIYKLPTVKE